jgi:hypothetical protein
VSDLGTSFDLLQQLWELLPVVHDLDAVALFAKSLLHLLHALLALLQLVDTDITNAGNTSTHRCSGTRLAVLDGHSLSWLDTELFAGVKVDLGVRLGGWWVEGGGCGVDVLVGEVLVDAGLLEGGDDTGLGGGRDDGHGVALLFETFELFWGTWAGLAFLAKLGSDGADFLADVLWKVSASCGATWSGRGRDFRADLI